MNVLLEIEYDGTLYSGWQRQDHAQTIQGELERAMLTYLNAERKKSSLDSLQSVSINGSGRTDAGVHALMQTANVFLPDDMKIDFPRLSKALNGITPRDIVVRQAHRVDDSFDARHSPHIKCYCYRICDRHMKGGVVGANSWCTGPLAVPPMIHAARLLEGQHDFQSFRASDCTAKTTIRTILRAEISRPEPQVLELRVIGKGFLKQMVRIIAGTLVNIGKGQIPAEDILKILALKDRRAAGPTAPPNALTLEWMKYNVLET